ncbi:MAG TPA: hypothetical protein VK841_09160 [Polyangiaceae bacterium]|jgi:hypothetical protein|nr:hypothetical protein [Polyangiaceae bacterium]
MKKRGFASFAVASAVLFARAASAQTQNVTSTDAPTWLGDRRYNEGIGIRSGDLELHPGIAGEFGYDSNYFLRSTQNNVVNGPPLTPPIPSLQLRVTPSLYVSTLTGERREGDVIRLPPPIAFRGGINGTAYFPIGISSDSSVKNLPGNDISAQRNVNIGADGRLEIMPERPVSGAVFVSYTRVTQADPSNATVAYDRDSIGGGAEIGLQPQSGTLDWHFQYQYSTTLFEAQLPQAFDNMTHEVSTRGRWKFTPRTSLVFDADQRFISYPSSVALANGLIGSQPIRTRLGFNGLITDRFAATLMAGYGGSFYDNTFNPQQYDSVIGLAELKWFLSASPGVAKATDLGLALSSIAVGYQRDFQNSYLGTYYGIDRGYLKFTYFFAGRLLATLEGGVAAIEYPRIQQPESTLTDPADLRASAFTDVRADATFFTEYRFTNTFGLNGTFRYGQEFSKTLVREPGNPVGATGAATNTEFAMDWQRFEVYVGVRWFL